jgi:hypothetical protein
VRERLSRRVLLSSQMAAQADTGASTLLVAVATAAGLLVLVSAPYAPDVVGAFVDFRRVHLAGVPLDGAVTYFALWAVAGLIGAGAALTYGWARGDTRPIRLLPGVLFAIGFLYGGTLQGRLESEPDLAALAIDPAHLVGSGMREPLGLLVGIVLGVGWAWVSRDDWRAVGDRIAVFAVTWIAFGRLGCLSTGCCMGGVCPAWMADLCLRYPPGTAVHMDQIRLQQLDVSSVALSHPAHALPVYFALVACALLVAFAVLVRRGAARGALLATFLLAYPVAKFLLEYLRATPRPGSLMTIVSLALLLLGLGLAATLRRTRVRVPSTPQAAPSAG